MKKESRKGFTQHHFRNLIEYCKNGAGFTLVELLVVIVIISVLAGLLVSNFIGVRLRGRDAQRKSDLAQIQSTALTTATIRQRSTQPRVPLQDHSHIIRSYICEKFRVTPFKKQIIHIRPLRLVVRLIVQPIESTLALKTPTILTKTPMTDRQGIFAQVQESYPTR